MKKYAIVFQKSLKSEFAYHSATIVGIVSALLGFFVQIFLWKALLTTNTHLGVNLTDMFLFVIINSAMYELTKGNVASKIETAMIDGTISIELLRPISYKYYTCAGLLGKNIYGTITKTIPICIISAFLIPISSLPDFPHVMVFLLSATMGVFLMFEVTYIVGLLAFWLQRCWFLSWYLNGFLTFFGGTFVPLWFYPDTLITISKYLPFRYMTFEPINVFLGKTQLIDAWVPLVIAAIWLVALSVIDKLIWNAAVRQLSINGG